MENAQQIMYIKHKHKTSTSHSVVVIRTMIKCLLSNIN